MGFTAWCQWAQDDIDKHVLYPNYWYDRFGGPNHASPPLTPDKAFQIFQQQMELLFCDKQLGCVSDKDTAALYRNAIKKSAVHLSNNGRQGEDVRLQGPVVEHRPERIYCNARIGPYHPKSFLENTNSNSSDLPAHSPQRVVWLTPLDELESQLDELRPQVNDTERALWIICHLGLGHYKTSLEKEQAEYMNLVLRRYKIMSPVALRRPTFLSNGTPDCFCCHSEYDGYGCTAELGTGNAALKECVARSCDLESIDDINKPYKVLKFPVADALGIIAPNLAAIRSRLETDAL